MTHRTPIRLKLRELVIIIGALPLASHTLVGYIQGVHDRWFLTIVAVLVLVASIYDLAIDFRDSFRTEPQGRRIR